jgi:neutral ceramidase
MNTFQVFRFLIIAAATFASVLYADGAEFRAGAAAVVITPPEGTPIAGYYHLRTADGVLDDLYAKALVLEQDGQKAALVTLDLITVTRPVVVEARRLIAEEAGIPPDHVMISATHSHTGPVLTRGGFIDELTGGKTELAHGYSGSLPKMIAQAVAMADKRLTPSVVSATAAFESLASIGASG